MSECYLNKKRYIKKINDLYLKLDNNQSDGVSLNEFFELIEIMEKEPYFQIPSYPDFAIWENFR